jgi:hypothetical protein
MTALAILERQITAEGSLSIVTRHAGHPSHGAEMFSRARRTYLS